MPKFNRDALFKWMKDARTWIFYFFIFFASFSRAVIWNAFSLLLILWLIEKICIFKWKVHRYFTDSELKLPLLIFFGICLLSTCIGLCQYEIWKGLLGRCFLFIMFFFLTQDTIDTAQKFRNALKILILSFFLVSLNGLYQLISGKGFIDGRLLEMGRYSNGNFPSLNVFGAYLTFVTPIAFSFLFHNYKINRGFKLALILVTLFLLLFSFSAEAWIFLSISLVIVFILMKPACSRLGLCLVLSFLIFLLILPATHNRLMNLYTQFGENGRVQLWRETIMEWKERPLFGFGINAVHTRTMKQGHLNYRALARQHPHNLYLTILLETGILGLGVFIWAVWRIIRKLVSLKNSYMGAGFLTGFFSFFLINLTDSIRELRMQTVFWVILGLVFAYAKLDLSARFQRH